jgi:hypothetical protein
MYNLFFKKSNRQNFDTKTIERSQNIGMDKKPMKNTDHEDKCVTNRHMTSCGNEPSTLKT